MTDSDTTTNADYNPVVVGRVHISGFSLVASDRMLGILCQDLTPAIGPNGDLTVISQPQIYMSMSVTSAKELHILLGEFVEQHESQFGRVTSDFIERRGKA